MKKKFLWLSVIFITFGMAFDANSSTLTNGTFDSDLSGWTIDLATTTGVTWISGAAHLGRPGTPGSAIFSQTFDIAPGEMMVDFNFDYQWQINPPLINDSFTAELILETTSGPLTVSMNELSGDVSNFNVDFNYSSSILVDMLSAANNATVRFTLEEFNNAAGTRIQLDNISVTESPVPEPTTMLLFGLGLLGVAGVNRRK